MLPGMSEGILTSEEAAAAVFGDGMWLFCDAAEWAVRSLEGGKIAMGSSPILMRLMFWDSFLHAWSSRLSASGDVRWGGVGRLYK